MINTEIAHQYYYFIPFAYETQVTQAVAEWTTTPNNGWTIITGVYAPHTSLINGNSTVQNVLRKDRERQNIALGFENFMSFDTQPQFMKLIGFTLYGDLDKFAPAFKAELMLLNGVVSIAEAAEYRAFLNGLNQ